MSADAGPQSSDGPFAYQARSEPGQRLSTATIERLVHRVGTVAAEAEAASARRLESVDPPPAEVRVVRLYVAVDGVMVRETDGFHEAKAVTCYWGGPSGKRESRY